MKTLMRLLLVGACALTFSGCPPEKTETNITPDGGGSAPESAPPSAPESEPGTPTTPNDGASGGSPIGPAPSP